MKPYFPFTLRSEHLLKKDTLNELNEKWISRSGVFTFNPTFKDSTMYVLNLELSSRKLPKLKYAVCFAREHDNSQLTHVDGTNYVTNASLNIPIFGTSGSVMEWYGGDYELEQLKHTDASGQPVAYWNVTPGEDFKPIDQLELIKSHFVQVNIPHRVISGPKEPRAVLCLRFEENWPIEKFINH
jgi:hypothetical protein